MSKLLCATPDIDICMTVLYLSISDSMAPIIWRTIVEIRDDYDKSALVQVVDWCLIDDGFFAFTEVMVEHSVHYSINLFGQRRSKICIQ